MERGLYIAASGMLAEMVRQDQIANDLANASTPGYKADRATQRSFGDMLLSNTVTGQEVGPLGLGSQIDSITTDTSAAPARETGEPLDFAVVGANGGPIRIGADGRVNPQDVAIFALNNPQKVGDSYVTGGAAGQATGTVRQGALEGSNADPARSMVDMIASFRAFESGQRVIRTIDETLAKASNAVGGLPN
jgi:flagellar basal-body rod protein FlgG